MNSNERLKELSTKPEFSNRAINAIGVKIGEIDLSKISIIDKLIEQFKVAPDVIIKVKNSSSNKISLIVDKNDLGQIEIIIKDHTYMGMYDNIVSLDLNSSTKIYYNQEKEVYMISTLYEVKIIMTFQKITNEWYIVKFDVLEEFIFTSGISGMSEIVEARRKMILDKYEKYIGGK